MSPLELTSHLTLPTPPPPESFLLTLTHLYQTLTHHLDLYILDTVDKTGTFTREVISEVEGLMCSARMDDVV